MSIYLSVVKYIYLSYINHSHVIIMHQYLSVCNDFFGSTMMRKE